MRREVGDEFLYLDSYCPLALPADWGSFLRTSSGSFLLLLRLEFDVNMGYVLVWELFACTKDCAKRLSLRSNDDLMRLEFLCSLTLVLGFKIFCLGDDSTRTELLFGEIAGLVGEGVG